MSQKRPKNERKNAKMVFYKGFLNFHRENDRFPCFTHEQPKPKIPRAGKNSEAWLYY